MAKRRRRRRRRRAPARRRRSPARTYRRSPRRARRKNPDIHTLKGKGQVAAAGAAYGYVRKQTKWGQETLEDLQVESIGPLASHGLLLHFGARQTSGKVSSWLDAAATACLGAAGINFGYTGFDVESAAALEGADPDYAGAVVYDEAE